MSNVCLWSPRWEIAGAPLTEFATTLLEEAPRVAVEARGLIWAEGHGLPAGRLAWRLLECLGTGWKRDEVRAGVAAVPIVAEAAARSGDAPVTIAEPGHEREFLAVLPISVLSPERRLAALLAGTGIRTCGELAALSREAVEVRLGAEGASLWRWARADDPRLLFAPISRERPHASLDFLDYIVTDAARLAFTAQALLGNICGAMRERGECARRMALTFPFSGGGALVRKVALARATADRATWLARIRGHLEQIELPDGVTGLSIRVEDLEPATGVQGDLFDAGFASAGAAEEALARLIDGGTAVVQPETTAHPLAAARSSWQPISPAEAIGASAEPRPEPPVPALVFRHLSTPRRVGVRPRIRRDHLMPISYRDGSRWATVREAAGPNRVSGGHDGEPFAREYWRCVDEKGRLLWLYRDALAECWYLHGWWE